MRRPEAAALDAMLNDAVAAEVGTTLGAPVAVGATETVGVALGAGAT